MAKKSITAGFISRNRQCRVIGELDVWLNYTRQKIILGNLTYCLGEILKKCCVVCVCSGVWGTRGRLIGA
jgi:hypothetical protein